MHPIIAGLIGAAGYGLAGYFKNSYYANFNIEKFAQSLIAGFLVGLIAWVNGIPLDGAYGIFVSMGGTALVQNIWKGIVRWVRKIQFQRKVKEALKDSKKKG